MLIVKALSMGVCVVSFFSMAATMRRLHRDLMHGTQQHPQVTNTDIKTAIEARMDSIMGFHLPKALSNHSPIGLSTPECSFISIDNTRRPSNALVTDPSGAVLLGMKVQHKSPNM